MMSQQCWVFVGNSKYQYVTYILSNKKERKKNYEKIFNKLATGALVAVMALTALAPISTFAAEGPFACDHPAFSKSITKNPTCTENGLYNKVCAICGVTLERDIVYPAIGHTFNKATYEDNKVKSLTCSNCNVTQNFTASINEDVCVHPKTANVNASDYDCEKDGYTGDTICLDCGKIIKTGETLAHQEHNWVKGNSKEPTCSENGEALYYCTNCGSKRTETIPAAHKWDEGKVTVEPTKTSEGKKLYTCTRCRKTKEETLAKLAETTKPEESTTPSTEKPTISTTPSTTSAAEVGTKFTVKGNQYTITKAGEVSFSKAKSGVKSLTIPSTVKFQGTVYKVTKINANVVKNNKKIKNAVIGANIKSIDNKAFNKCPNLKKVTVQTTALTKKTANKKCFNKVNKKLTIKVPKKVKKYYKKIFKGFAVK